MNFIIGIFQFLTREKLYTALLIVIIGFFIFIRVYHDGELSHPDEFSQKQLKEVEMTIQKNSRNPEFLKKRFEEAPRLRWSLQVFTMGAFASLLIGVVMNIGMFQKWRKKESWLPPRVFGGRAKWDFEEIAKVSILVIFAGLLLTAAGFVFHRFLGLDFNSNFFMIAHTTAIDLIALFLMVHFVRQKEGKGRFVFGVRAPEGWFREIFMGIKSYFAIIPHFFLTLVLLLLIISRWAYEPPPHPLIGVFVQESERAPWVVFYSLILACVIGPIVEEVFFRGFLYPVIRKYIGTHWAMIATAVLFALIHENLFSFLPIFILGLALAYLYEKRGNLLACIVLHIFHNTVFITYFFLIKETFLS